MKLISSITGLIVLLLTTSACNQNDLNHQSPLAEYSGKWVILNYWAEWCGPCIEEIPELNALNRQHGDTLVVLAVNFDRISGNALQELSQRMNIQFDSIDPDPADALKLSRPASLPTTYLFNPRGELSAKLVGPQSEQSLLNRIALLEQR